MLRGGVAGAAAFVLAALSGCGGDEEDTAAIELHVVGEPQPGVPSQIAWQVPLENEADIETVVDETLILSNPVGDRVWGLTTWRGGQVFELDPSTTPWSRGPLVAVTPTRILLNERRSDAPGDTWLVAFEVANGGQRWSVRLGLRDARPLVIGDAVIVATRDDAAAGIDGAVRGIALADGSERWSLPLELASDEDPERGDYDDTSPVLSADGSTLAVRTGRSSVAVVDAADGREVGTFETDGEILTARPVESEGVVLITEEVDRITARLHAYDIDTAAVRWTVDAGESATWVNESAVVIHGIDRDYEAIRMSDGELLWSTTGHYGRIIAESEGTLITERLAAMAADDGDIVWSKFDAFTDHPWFAPGVVIVDDADEVTAFDLDDDGGERWSRSSGWNIVAVVGDDVLVAERDGYVLVDGASGAELWTLTRPDGATATALDTDAGTLFVSITHGGTSTVLALQPST